LLSKVQYPSNEEIAATLLSKVPKGVHNVLVDFISRLYADINTTFVGEEDPVTLELDH
jgi:hypothetical protein